jgi:hypothetical protein
VDIKTFCCPRQCIARIFCWWVITGERERGSR